MRKDCNYVQEAETLLQENKTGVTRHRYKVIITAKLLRNECSATTTFPFLSLLPVFCGRCCISAANSISTIYIHPYSSRKASITYNNSLGPWFEKQVILLRREYHWMSSHPKMKLWEKTAFKATMARAVYSKYPLHKGKCTVSYELSM